MKLQRSRITIGEFAYIQYSILFHKVFFYLEYLKQKRFLFTLESEADTEICSLQLK